MHQWIEFGFAPWQERGTIQREYSLEKAPVLLIQKESYLPPVIIREMPTDRKALLRLLGAHRFDWVQALSPLNFKELCDPTTAKKDGHWCIVFLASGNPPGNHIGLSAISSVAMHKEWSDLLPASASFARIDSATQHEYLNGVLSQVNKQDVRCQEWGALTCFLAVNTKRREFVTWPKEQSVTQESLVEWLKGISSDLQSGSYAMRRQGGNKAWPALVEDQSSGGVGVLTSLAVNPATIIVMVMAAFVLLGPPEPSKAGQPRRAR